MQRKNLKRLLIGFILLSAGSVVAVFIGYRQIMEDPEKLIGLVPENAQVALGKVEHTATRDGRIEWRLEAESAQIQDGAKRIIFQNLAVEFYLEDGSQLNMKADEGRLQTDSNDMEVSGQVEVSNDDYRLNTDKLFYDHGKQRLRAPVAVEIVSDSTHLEADAMAFDIKAQQTHFSGKVKGIFSGRKVL